MTDRKTAEDTRGTSPQTRNLEWELTVLARTLESIQRRRRYPLERAQYLHLRLILAEGAQTISNLAARFALDDSTVTRQVAAMEAAGLVFRVVNPDDHRSYLIDATPIGRSKTEAMHARRLERIDALIAEWPDAERETAPRLLAKLNRGLMESL